jgi:N-acetylneuraminate lyase
LAATAKLELAGVIPALVTPCDHQGNLDLRPVGRLLEFLLARHVSGFFVCGSTGEGFALSIAERKLLAEEMVVQVARRAPVIVHVGSMDFREVVALARHAGQIGTAAVSSVLPFFYGYHLDEICAYYQAICDASGLPAIVYALDAVAQLSFPPQDLIDRLLRTEGIYGVKYSGCNLHEMQRLGQLSGGRIRLFGGSDDLAVPMLIMGASGLIGSNYNSLPELWVAAYRAFAANDLKTCAQLQDRITYYMSRLRQVPPVPRAKAILRLRGIETGPLRLPWASRTAENEAGLRDVLDEISADPALARILQLE